MYKYNILYDDDDDDDDDVSNICMHENTRKQKLRQHNKYFLCFVILF